jgi:hypothetical protein
MIQSCEVDDLPLVKLSSKSLARSFSDLKGFGFGLNFNSNPKIEIFKNYLIDLIVLDGILLL